MRINFLNIIVFSSYEKDETLEQANTDCLGELWIKMLRFYTIDTVIEEIVISIRKREAISRDELKIPNRRLAIEGMFEGFDCRHG